MTLKTLTLRIGVALFALLSAALLGAYALQSRQMEREIADLPLVRIDPVVVMPTAPSRPRPAPRRLRRTPRQPLALIPRPRPDAKPRSRPAVSLCPASRPP